MKLLKTVLMCMLMSGLLMLNLIDIKTIEAASQSYGSSGPANITNLTVPTLLKQGECCSVKGRVSVNYSGEYSWKCGIAVYKAEYLEQGRSMQDRLSAKIRYASSESGWYSNSTKTYDLANLDYAIEFNSLTMGQYAYSIYVCRKTSYNKTYEDYYTCEFIVDSRTTYVPTKTASNVAFTKYTSPKRVYKGNYFVLSGDVVELFERFNNNGNVSKTSYPCSMCAVVTKKVNNKSVTINSGSGKFAQRGSAFSKYKRKQPMPKAVDNQITFNTFDRGTYKLTYYIYNFRTENSDIVDNGAKIADFEFKIE